jgi:hypothetical protein
MEWFVVVIIVLIIATLFVVRRSGWSSGLNVTQQYQRDLTQRTRTAEDEVRDAISHREKDVAP